MTRVESQTIFVHNAIRLNVTHFDHTNNNNPDSFLFCPPFEWYELSTELGQGMQARTVLVCSCVP